MEPQLRKLGLHTSLKKGVVTLDEDFQICKKGDKLTPEQARLLKLFEHMQAEFKIKVKMFWSKTSNEFELLDDSIEEQSVEDDEQTDDDENQENMAVEEPEEPNRKKLKNNKKSKKDENNN